MGLAASQFRYLSLTARKSDLEYQSQMINNARIQLANESADATRAYSDRMSNQCIRISHTGMTTDGKTSQVWEELTYANLMQQGYRVIGNYGTKLEPSPYTDYAVGDTIPADVYASLPTEYKGDDYVGIDVGKATYTVKKAIHITQPNYNGMDIQTLLVSGTGNIVSDVFYQYLVKHGYNSGVYVDDDGNPTSYEELLEKFQNNTITSGTPTVIDWRADQSSTFKQTLYTEDDEQALADYEATTAKIQAEDKKLECQLKKIETEHKAIETEQESLKKVIDKDIEQTYKSFA